MVILNILGIIEKKYISKKLGLYISNLPNDVDMNGNNWQEEIKDTLSVAYETEKLKASKFIGKYGFGTKNMFQERVLESAIKMLDLQSEKEEDIIKEYIDYLSKNMIYIGIDYQNTDIPKEDNVFSCFDGGSCEEDPVEKLLSFFDFLYANAGRKTTIPYCIYSTRPRLENDYRFLFGGTTDIENQIRELMKIGKQLDDFLISDKDFYQLDYLCNALFDININERNTYHYMKVYSICAMFLEKEKEMELDYKLPCLMDLSVPISERNGMAELMRKIRNKIAHGDFEKLNSLLEEYAKRFMDGKFSFDYDEYTRTSWVLLHISCTLEGILRKLINMMLTDSEKLADIKNQKNN